MEWRRTTRKKFPFPQKEFQGQLHLWFTCSIALKSRGSSPVRSQMTGTSYWTRSWVSKGGQLRPCPSRGLRGQSDHRWGGQNPNTIVTPRPPGWTTRGDSPMPGKERQLPPRRPSPSKRAGWGSVIQRGLARRGYRESPGPSGPREAEPVGASLPAASLPGRPPGVPRFLPKSMKVAA